MGETIGARLAKVPSPMGFNYLRIALALTVVIAHSYTLTIGGRALFRDTVLGPVLFMIVPMFFALGGFLVAGSLERSRTVAGFLTLRVVRMVPALAAEILLSALLIGPLVTDVPLHDYFASPLFARYFLNLLAIPQYHLPGVFTGNVVPMVNQQLWTLPWEFGVYSLLALLAALGLVRRRWALPLIVLAMIVSGVTGDNGVPGPMSTRNGLGLILAFLIGVTIYQFRNQIPRSKLLAAISPFAAYGLLLLPNGFTPAMVPIAYLTVWLGLLDPPSSRLAGEADYSYGVYLFSYPIQQLLWLWPPLRIWYLNMFAALPIVLLVAMCSWHWIEWPALRRKKAAVALVEAVTGRLAVPFRAAGARLGLGSRLAEPSEPGR